MNEKQHKISKTNECFGKIIRKSDKTVVVEVKRRIKHAKYGKILNISFKYMVHNPYNKHKIGDLITIRPCRPYSSKKKWIVTNIFLRSI